MLPSVPLACTPWPNPHLGHPGGERSRNFLNCCCGPPGPVPSAGRSEERGGGNTRGAPARSVEDTGHATHLSLCNNHSHIAVPHPGRRLSRALRNNTGLCARLSPRPPGCSPSPRSVVAEMDIDTGARTPTDTMSARPPSTSPSQHSSTTPTASGGTTSTTTTAGQMSFRRLVGPAIPAP